MAQLYREAKQQQRLLITSNYVITEVVALLTSPLKIPRPKIISFINSIKQSPYIDIIHIDRDKDDDAWILLANREDKEWSERRLFKFYYYEGKRNFRSLN